MSTYLGASAILESDSIDLTQLLQSKILYCEGFLYATDGGRKSCQKLLQEAKKQSICATLSLSDPILVKNNRNIFLEHIGKYCDIVFCNESELLALFDSQDLQWCKQKIVDYVSLIYITQSDQGAICLYKRNDAAHTAVVNEFYVMAKSVELSSVNGAGDTFVGATLYALCKGYHPKDALEWGNEVASRVVQIHEPRLIGPITFPHSSR